jgi:hypothetical protein
MLTKKKTALGLIFALYVSGSVAIQKNFKDDDRRALIQQIWAVFALVITSQNMSSRINAPLAMGIVLFISSILRHTLPLDTYIKEQWDSISVAISVFVVSILLGFEAGGILFATTIVPLLVIPMVFLIPSLSYHTSWDFNRIQQALEISELAYGYRKGVIDTTTNFVYNEESGTLAGCKVAKDYIAVFFSGSNSLMDFTHTNINVGATKVDYSLCNMNEHDLLNARVHEGFWNAYNSVRSQLLTLLTQMSFQFIDKKEIIVTGHSLGGALATLAVPDICSLFEDNITLITFAAPQVGNESFGKLISTFVPPEKCIRVITSFDHVPHILGTIFNHHPSKVLVLPGTTVNPLDAHAPSTYRKALQTYHPNHIWILLITSIIISILLYFLLK